MKNDGVSYLQTMQDDEWTKNLYKQQPKGFVPEAPFEQKKDGGPKIDISESVNKELVSSDINELNVSSEISDIDPKYQEGGQYSSGGKKLEKEVNKLNEDVEGLAKKPIRGNKTSVGSTVFTPGNTIENFFSWPKNSGGLGGGIAFGKVFQRRPDSFSAELISGLKDITNKDHKDGNFTAEDLLKIETQYNDDVVEKEKLVNQYKSLRKSGVDKNSPDMLALQNQINDIYQKWHAREETDIGTFQELKIHPYKKIKRDWNLALEESGAYSKGATALYKFMGFLRLRFDEEKQNVKEQSNKVKNIKKNLS